MVLVLVLVSAARAFAHPVKCHSVPQGGSSTPRARSDVTLCNKTSQKLSYYKIPKIHFIVKHISTTRKVQNFIGEFLLVLD